MAKPPKQIPTFADLNLELHTDGRPIFRGQIISTFWTPIFRQSGRKLLGAQFMFVCPYCKHGNGRPIKHYHGWTLGTPIETLEHRNAHCNPSGPLYDRGYYIAIDPSADHACDPLKGVCRDFNKITAELECGVMN